MEHMYKEEKSKPNFGFKEEWLVVAPWFTYNISRDFWGCWKICSSQGIYIGHKSLLTSLSGKGGTQLSLIPPFGAETRASGWHTLGLIWKWEARPFRGVCDTAADPDPISFRWSLVSETRVSGDMLVGSRKRFSLVLALGLRSRPTF